MPTQCHLPFEPWVSWSPSNLKRRRCCCCWPRSCCYPLAADPLSLAESTSSASRSFQFHTRHCHRVSAPRSPRLRSGGGSSGNRGTGFLLLTLLKRASYWICWSMDEKRNGSEFWYLYIQVTGSAQVYICIVVFNIQFRVGYKMMMTWGRAGEREGELGKVAAMWFLC